MNWGIALVLEIIYGWDFPQVAPCKEFNILAPIRILEGIE